mgnify:CR=1 FL=1
MTPSIKRDFSVYRSFNRLNYLVLTKVFLFFFSDRLLSVLNKSHTGINHFRARKFLKSPLLLILEYGKNKQNTLQISNCPLVQYQKPLVWAVGQVECSCPANISWKSCFCYEYKTIKHNGNWNHLQMNETWNYNVILIHRSKAMNEDVCSCLCVTWVDGSLICLLV